MKTASIRLAVALAITALVLGACSGAAAPTATPAPTAAPNGGSPIAFDATAATIVVDGSNADWSSIQGATVSLEQIRLDNLDPADAAELDFGPLAPVNTTLKVATDQNNIYVLFEVPGTFVYDAADHNKSASVTVMFKIDAPAEPHMGAEEPNIDQGLGMVDMWHWELDCGPGLESGGGDIAGGDDPACNLDDEYSTKPSDREDDGGGDIENADADNALTGVWSHTAQGSGAGAAGTWVFEMSRPLQTGDPQDAQFVSGSVAQVALAYFDPTESADGWTDVGHLQSAYHGWIAVTLP
jgi:hypothetical protein